ncbi:MAG: DUF3299 domain-containing protein [Betaproteobacteria bacterium]|nr:DUF3299 domain-containing protein [Betaproteobacteria bacterium]
MSRALIIAAGLAGVGAGVTAFSADRGPAYQLGERLPQAKAATPASGFRAIKWDDLIPADWDPRQLFKGIDLSMLDDSDPRAIRALEKLREVWSNAPSKAEMHGNRVRISGFVVPLERKGKQITEFLLVPYFGACIHVPPPPSNQIIHVSASKPVRDTATMDAVWVDGTLEVARSETGMGAASYRLRAELVAPYWEPGRSR